MAKKKTKEDVLVESQKNVEKMRLDNIHTPTLQDHRIMINYRSRAALAGSKQDLRGSKQDLRGSKKDLRGSKQDLRGSKKDLRSSKPDTSRSIYSSSVVVNCLFTSCGPTVVTRELLTSQLWLSDREESEVHSITINYQLSTTTSLSTQLSTDSDQQRYFISINRPKSPKI